MNADILRGLWKQIKGHLRRWWGRFTDDETATIRGNWEVRYGKLQERYGHTRSRSARALARWLNGA